LSRIHSTDIVGTRFDPAEHNALAAIFPINRFVCMENYAPSCGTGTGR
jgi:hypothetical protein